MPEPRNLLANATPEDLERWAEEIHTVAGSASLFEDALGVAELLLCAVAKMQRGCIEVEAIGGNDMWCLQRGDKFSPPVLTGHHDTLPSALASVLTLEAPDA